MAAISILFLIFAQDWFRMAMEDALIRAVSCVFTKAGRLNYQDALYFP